MSHESKPARGPAPVWMKLALAVSLALNLVVAGAIGGIGLRRAADLPGGGVWQAQGPAEPGLRAAIGALDPEDRRALRRAWGEGIRAEHGRARAVPVDAQMLVLLRQSQLDEAALRAQFDSSAQRVSEIGRRASALLAERIAAMPFEDRHAYADRLEAALARRVPRPPLRTHTPAQ